VFFRISWSNSSRRNSIELSGSSGDCEGACSWFLVLFIF